MPPASTSYSASRPDLLVFKGSTPIIYLFLSCARALYSRLSYLPQPAQAGPGASHLQQGRVTGSQQEHREYLPLYDCLANTPHKSRDTLLITWLDWIDCVCCCCCVGIKMCTVLDSGLQFGPQIILQNCKIARLNVTGFLWGKYIFRSQKLRFFYLTFEVCKSYIKH